MMSKRVVPWHEQSVLPSSLASAMSPAQSGLALCLLLQPENSIFRLSCSDINPKASEVGVVRISGWRYVACPQPLLTDPLSTSTSQFSRWAPQTFTRRFQAILFECSKFLPLMRRRSYASSSTSPSTKLLSTSPSRMPWVNATPTAQIPKVYKY